MLTRPATHSGSWYSKDRTVLSEQVARFLAQAPPPKPGARVLVGPHAGYAYCGQRLAETYKAWDCRHTQTVFILGPSHHVFFQDTALLTAHAGYSTPLGHVPVATGICEALVGQGLAFGYMSGSVDADEHLFEMHLPFLVQRCLDENIPVPRVVPIMVSGLSAHARGVLVAALRPYFADPHNTFVVLSDFCHWGRRFGYTKYVSDPGLLRPTAYEKAPAHKVPIYKSIEYLDRSAMQVAAAGLLAEWDAYIETTGNTICGQRPIAVVLLLLEDYRARGGELASGAVFQWLGYSQSSRATSASDSSVSYAAGYVQLK
ncbi:UPF0103-domain-containing protein [Metschnikowia bicuspidata var. bicuspidata NRRL YB-4993]|uniref:UPF0103-domain-containing protein n=1 Tax=Metschnikowia bicuspidata var. bicuspidata NRRL YB-4993 TaxID=869754 RepID=A0A1A0H4Y4_9ASCO|nr:UPF0103-domain-containing protein [Metschnikowia bicuspidata var. bicuspidata NRRL YB-4993]OBA19139.1 UPF0103-domain-containing protein [Metschnikowia bicuspidata var. bicuspidata NRRL YB-4993]